MKGHTKVTCCPYCKGTLSVSYFYVFSKDYLIRKDGHISERFSRSVSSFIDCITASCLNCGAYWDADGVLVEQDGTVSLKI